MSRRKKTKRKQGHHSTSKAASSAASSKSGKSVTKSTYNFLRIAAFFLWPIVMFLLRYYQPELETIRAVLYSGIPTLIALTLIAVLIRPK